VIFNRQEIESGQSSINMGIAGLIQGVPGKQNKNHAK